MDDTVRCRKRRRSPGTTKPSTCIEVIDVDATDSPLSVACPSPPSTQPTLVEVMPEDDDSTTPGSPATAVAPPQSAAVAAGSTQQRSAAPRQMTLTQYFVGSSGAARRPLPLLDQLREDGHLIAVTRRIEDRGSIFLVHACAGVVSPECLHRFVAAVRSSIPDGAAHPAMFALRYPVWQNRPDATDDNGERYAGDALLRGLRDPSDVRGVAVVASRWFGGVLLGPVRFAYLTTLTREAVQQLESVSVRPACV